MARRIEVVLAGDSSSLEKAYARGARSTTRFNKEVGKLSRGALAGSGAFHTFGRSIAFASGGFIAAHTATEFLTESINAAREAAVAQQSLAAQMRTSGESFKANRDQIEKVSLAYGKFGFQNDEVVQSLTVLDRATGNINTSMRLQGGVADLARASNKRLADAAAIVGKTLAGQETALRRAVPGLSKTAHGADLVQQAFQRLRGQAAANTTSSDRFAASLHNTEEIIGTALLPTLNKYLDKLSTWLNDSENQAKLQKTVNRLTNAGADAFSALADAIGFATDAYDKYQGLVSHAPGGKKGFLQTLLGGTLKNQLDSFTNSFKKSFDAWNKMMGAPLLFQAKPGLPGPTTKPALPGLIGRPGFGFVPPSQAQTRTAAAAAGARATSLQGQLNLAALRLAKAQTTKSAQDDLAALRQEQRVIEKMLAAKKGSLKERTALYEQLGSVEEQIRGITDQAAAKAQQQAEKAAAQARQRREKLRQAAERASQFTVPDVLQVAQARAAAQGQDAFAPLLRKVKAAAEKALRSGRLGVQGQIDAWNTIADVNKQLADAAQKAKDRFSQFSVSLNLQVAEAKAAALGESVRPILLKMKQAAEKALKSRKLSLQGQLDAWNTIADVNSQLADMAKKTSNAVSGAVSPAAVISRMPRAFIGAGATPRLGFAAGMVVHNQTVNVYGVQNVRQLEGELISRSKGRPQTRRGN